MSEPKKETVRIVLPQRREGETLASTPRESAMINLPPKPVPAGGEPAAPAAPTIPPPSVAAPKPPGSLQPPAAPGIPKPPSFPGVPKPPSAPAAPTAPKPAAPAPAAATTMRLQKPPTIGPAPAAVKPQPKKETAKISVPGAAAKPQATVQLQPRPQAAQTSFNIQPVEAAEETEVIEEEEIPMNLAIVAVVAAAVALLLQVWMML